jgi:hypothetical protein
MLKFTIYAERIISFQPSLIYPPRPVQQPFCMSIRHDQFIMKQQKEVQTKMGKTQELSMSSYCFIPPHSIPLYQQGQTVCL